MMGFGFVGMFLFGGVVLALLAGGGLLLLRQAGGSGPGGERQRLTAREILDERFALGEIGGEEYDAVRAQIER